jgi:hypothetical protein
LFFRVADLKKMRVRSGRKIISNSESTNATVPARRRLENNKASAGKLNKNK